MQIEHRFGRDAMGRLIRRVSSQATQRVVGKRDDLGFAFRMLPVARVVRAPDLQQVVTCIVAIFRHVRLLDETSSQGVLRHAYDELGNRTSTTLPDGRTINLLYYGSGHLHQINVDGQSVSDFDRDRLHREVLRSQGRLGTRSLYDAGGRISRRQSYREMRGVMPDSVIDRHYGYDALSRLVDKRHTLQGQTSFSYDAEGLITECRNDGYYGTWRYDAAANLLDESQRGCEQGNVIRFNRLLAMRGRRYAYDAHGRMTHRDSADGMQRYRYDAHHRLVEARVERTGLPERRYGYEYDALGRRTAKYQIDPDGQRHSYVRFLWDGMRMVQEVRPDGAASVYLYNGAGSYEPLARLDDGHDSSTRSTLYYHTDVNGAPEELTDANGEIVWRMQYQVWGNTVVETAVETYRPQQNLRYQGQYLDRETGLHYNTFRYYDPDVGRFITPDPIGLAGGLNVYAYASDPVGWIDPWGLCPTTAKEEPNWTPHGFKHSPSKNMTWGDIVKSTKSGSAKYKPGINIESLERSVFKEGTPVTNGKPWKVMDMGETVGASEGKPTQWIRVEESGGTIHGHPISLSEFNKLTKL